MADHMRTELVEDALKAAWRERGSLRAAVFHSDHGSVVYTSKDYTALCQQLGVLQSMGAIGSADNALAESFNAALKRELLDAAAFPEAPTTYRAVFRWVNRYNTRRRHSAIGNIAPNAYEAATTARLAEAA